MLNTFLLNTYRQGYSLTDLCNDFNAWLREDLEPQEGPAPQEGPVLQDDPTPWTGGVSYPWIMSQDSHVSTSANPKVEQAIKAVSFFWPPQETQQISQKEDFPRPKGETLTQPITSNLFACRVVHQGVNPPLTVVPPQQADQNNQQLESRQDPASNSCQNPQVVNYPNRQTNDEEHRQDFDGRQEVSISSRIQDPYQTSRSEDDEDQGNPQPKQNGCSHAQQVRIVQMKKATQYGFGQPNQRNGHEHSPPPSYPPHRPKQLFDPLGLLSSQTIGRQSHNSLLESFDYKRKKEPEGYGDIVNRQLCRGDIFQEPQNGDPNRHLDNLSQRIRRSQSDVLLQKRGVQPHRSSCVIRRIQSRQEEPQHQHARQSCGNQRGQSCSPSPHSGEGTVAKNHEPIQNKIQNIGRDHTRYNHRWPPCPHEKRRKRREDDVKRQSEKTDTKISTSVNTQLLVNEPLLSPKGQREDQCPNSYQKKCHLYDRRRRPFKSACTVQPPHKNLRNGSERQHGQQESVQHLRGKDSAIHGVHTKTRQHEAVQNLHQRPRQHRQDHGKRNRKQTHNRTVNFFLLSPRRAHPSSAFLDPQAARTTSPAQAYRLILHKNQ